MTNLRVEAQSDELLVCWSGAEERRQRRDATFINRLRRMRIQQPTSTRDATRQPIA